MSKLADMPWPKNEDALLNEIRAALQDVEMGNVEIGYNQCPEVMARCALAAFRYAGSVLGVTGFQASCADLMFLAASRRMKHGFIVLDANNLMYPQYDLRAQLDEWITKTEPELAEAAAKNLAESPDAHPAVRARWAQLAALKETK